MSGFEDFSEKIQYEPQQRIFFPSLNPGNCFRITNPSGSSMTFMVEKFDPITGLWAICLAHDDLPQAENMKVVFDSEAAILGEGLTFKIPSPKNPTLVKTYFIDKVEQLGLGPKVGDSKPEVPITRVIDATSKEGKDFLRRLTGG